jgi:hypothetical protein
LVERFAVRRFSYCNRKKMNQTFLSKLFFKKEKSPLSTTPLPPTTPNPSTHPCPSGGGEGRGGEVRGMGQGGCIKRNNWNRRVPSKETKRN